MKRFRSGFELVGVAVIGAVLLVVGCDSPDTLDAVSPKLHIKERAEARWVALASGNYAGAYAFETPAYRSTVSLEQFRSQFGAAVRWVGAKVDSMDVSEAGDRAEVKVMLEYEAPTPIGSAYTGRRPMFERWIASEGDWWYVRD